EFYQYSSRILEKHKISLDRMQNITIELPKDYASLSVLNPYHLENNELIIEGKDIEFSFVNLEALEKGKKYYFTRRVEPKLDTPILKLTFFLDEGFVVSKDIYPKPENIESDGKHIIINWRFENLTEKDSVALFVILESVNRISYLQTITIIILLIIITALIVYFIKRLSKKEIIKKKRAKKKAEEITRFLLENEKKVIDELIKEKELWQKQLQLRTGLSKVKLSRVLKNLENRGLIKKINFGKTNKILLTKRK
ncbi:MAG: hypothetical protein QXO70_01980, partial [Candidatus Pacearchaeota archaeon]